MEGHNLAENNAKKRRIILKILITWILRPLKKV